MIEDYDFGRIVVDGQAYDRDVILIPPRPVIGWWRQTGHEVCVDDLAAILEAKPEVVVIGTGAYGRVTVLAEAEQALRKAGANVIAEPTDEACKTYNRLLAEGKRVTAGLHLTC
jgi:hypothetical protein